MYNQSVGENDSHLFESTLQEQSIEIGGHTVEELGITNHPYPIQRRKSEECQLPFSHLGSKETNTDNPNLQAYPESSFANDAQQMEIESKTLDFREEYPNRIKKSPSKKEQEYYYDEVPMPISTFEQRQIEKSKFNFEEFLEEGTEVAETQLTLSQKLKSKIIKARMQALDQLVLLVENDPYHPDVEEADMTIFLKQTHPGCLERALNCFRIWVLKGKIWGDEEAKLVIENGFANGKGNVRKLALDIVDLMYQFKPDCTEINILVGLKSKNAKNIISYLSILNELLAIYGIVRMKNLKPYFHEIVSVLNCQKNTSVQSQGISLLKQAYKQLSKDAVEPFLKELKDNIKKELDSFWEEFDSENVMKAPKEVNEVFNFSSKKKVDAYELADPIDVFRKYNERFTEVVLREERWNQKVDLMKDFVNAATVPRILNTTDHRHINDMVRKLINHSNFHVVIWDLKILATLAKGLRKHFTPVVKSVFSHVICKFRQKKTQMIDQTYNTLQQFQYCISIEDVLDDIREGLCDKVPGMKIHLLNWITKVVQQKIQESQQIPERTEEALRNIYPLLQKLMGDSLADVRIATVKAIGKFKTLLGDHFFETVEVKMNRTMSDKIHDVKSKTVMKKLSKEKQKKETKGDNNGRKVQMRQSQVMIPRGKGDVSDQIEVLIPKMNHPDWIKRKQSAETVISLLSEIQGRLSFSCTNDLLATLKLRIADPNKQLIRIFVDLTGMMFEIMSQKEVRQHGKAFICGLADGLSDKMEISRREIYAVLSKIGSRYGQQHLLSLLGPYLNTDKDSRIEIISLILQNADFLPKADIRDYPKGIIKCLTDKNREIRILVQKLFQLVYEKIGLDVFRNITRTEKPAIAKELNNIFDKYDPAKQKKSNLGAEKKSCPVPPRKKVPEEPPSTKKMCQNSDQKNSTKKSFKQEHEEYRKSPARGLNGRNGRGGKKGSVDAGHVRRNETYRMGSRSNHHSSERNRQEYKIPKVHHRNLNNPPQPPQHPSPNNRLRHEFYGQNHPPQYGPPSNIISLLPSFPTFVQANNQFASLDILSSQQLHRNQKQPWLFDHISQEEEDGLTCSLYNLINTDLVKKMLSFDHKRVLEAISHLIKILPSHQAETIYLYDILLKWVLIRLVSGNMKIRNIIEVVPAILSILYRKKKTLSNNELELVMAIIRQYFTSAFLNNYKTSQSIYSIIDLTNSLSVDLIPLLLFQFKLNVEGEEGTAFYKYEVSNLVKSLLMKGVEEEMLVEIFAVPELREDEGVLEILRNKFDEEVLMEYGFIVEKEQYVESESESEEIHHHHIHSLPKRQQQHIQTGISIKQVIHQEVDLSEFPSPAPNSILHKHLQNLFPPNETSIKYMSEVFSEPSADDQLETYGKIVFGSVLKSITLMFQSRDEYSPDKIVNQIYLLQHALRCEPVIEHIGDLIYNATKFAITQLVHEDQNKYAIAEELEARGYEHRLDYFVKVINGVMLRILENANPQELSNVLLRLLCQQQREPNPSRKIAHLIIKCLVRLPGSFTENTHMEQTYTDQFLPLFNEYLNLIQLDYPLEDFNPIGEKQTPEESALKSLKDILEANIQFYGQEIWVCYQNGRKEVRHDYIREFILAMGIDQPSNHEDSALVRIKELLQKAKTFDSGITELRRYESVNSSFSTVEYLNSQGYDQNFVMAVMTSLEGKPLKHQLQEERSIKKEQASPNIQQKIQKLKKKFEQSLEQSFQPSLSISKSNQKGRDQNFQRAHQMKKKLHSMRYKFGDHNGR